MLQKMVVVSLVPSAELRFNAVAGDLVRCDGRLDLQGVAAAMDESMWPMPDAVSCAAGDSSVNA